MPSRSTTLLRWIAIIGVIALAAGAWIVSRRPADPLLVSPERRAWKEEAISAIQKRAADKPWLAGELARLRSKSASRPCAGGWVGDELLVLKNGDWIICQNVCAKERQTGVKRDLFIGRGSDGRWYYSTFHFCVGKCVLLMESQPESLAKFAEGYWLERFDGKSEECLKVTWDAGKPYGDERLQPR